MPKNIILNEGEELVKTIRQSFFSVLLSLLLPIILIILSFFLLYPLFSWGDKGVIIFFATLLFGIGWLIKNIIIWYWNTFTITNQKIIDTDQNGVLQKIVSEIPLEKIQDVFYKIKGIRQTLTRTGNLYISLNNSKTKIEISDISQPKKIQQLIIQLKAEEIEKKSDLERLSTQDLINSLKKIKNKIGSEKFNEILTQKEDEN